MWVIALGVAIPGVIIVAKKFWRRIKEVIGRLYKDLAGYLFAQQENFEDEITDIRREARQEKADTEQKKTKGPFCRLSG